MSMIGAGRRRPRGLRGIAQWVRRALAPEATDYEAWLQRYDTLDDDDRTAILAGIRSLSLRPLLSLLLPVCGAPPSLILKTIGSVEVQLYQDWELCIAVADPVTAAALRDRISSDQRIKIAITPHAGTASAAHKAALDAATGEFIGLLGPGDEMPSHALFMIAVELNAHPRADFVYSDEDELDAGGRRRAPRFKPDWAPGSLLSYHLTGSLGIYRTELARAAGGFRPGFEGALEYDLALRVSARTTIERIRHIPHVLYHRRVSAGPETSPRAVLGNRDGDARRALADLLADKGEAAQVIALDLPGCCRIVWPLPDPLPRVSLIVPTRDRLDLLRPCVDGILHRTRYPCLDLIIIDNGSRDTETLNYLRDLGRDPRVCVLRIDGPFNFSALNNQAAGIAEGELLGFINNDIAIIDAGWLEEMVREVIGQAWGPWAPSSTMPMIPSSTPA